MHDQCQQMRLTVFYIRVLNPFVSAPIHKLMSIWILSEQGDRENMITSNQVGILLNKTTEIGPYRFSRKYSPTNIQIFDKLKISNENQTINGKILFNLEERRGLISTY